MRRRILRAFVGRGLLESFAAKEMLAYQHSEPSGDKRGAKADELSREYQAEGFKYTELYIHLRP